MEIKLNGESLNLPQSTLMELVRHRGLDPGAVVIEHNLKVIDQDAWDTTQINHGDTIELLSFVGGG
ncbi:MAG: sulfur carrier protein ThiS [Desulfobacteraceae bacterium]|nr:sulfur carrier protein ThiS [Desulfobacteraceae bacterium]